MPRGRKTNKRHKFRNRRDPLTAWSKDDHLAASIDLDKWDSIYRDLSVEADRRVDPNHPLSRLLDELVLQLRSIVSIKSSHIRSHWIDQKEPSDETGNSEGFTRGSHRYVGSSGCLADACRDLQSSS